MTDTSRQPRRRSIRSLLVPLAALVLVVVWAGTGGLRGTRELPRRLTRLEARYYAGEGHRLARHGDLRGAVRAYLAALAADSRLASLYLDLGYAYERLGDSSGQDGEESRRRAAVCFRQAADSVPVLRRTALLRLAGLQAPGRLDERGPLEATLDQLVRLDGTKSDLALALARLREDAGRVAQAEATLVTVSRAMPDGTVQRELARFYRRHERMEASLHVLERRLSAAPDDRDALLAVAEDSFYRAHRDHRLDRGQRLDEVRRGLTSVRRLLRLEPHHAAAKRYLPLLLRLEAQEAGNRG